MFQMTPEPPEASFETQAVGLLLRMRALTAAQAGRPFA
jgi:hypothetical protein